MTKLALGLMSGTSADGLTVCAVQLRPFRVQHFHNYTYTPQLQQKLLRAYELNAAQLSELNYELGLLYAKFVRQFLKKFQLTPADICVIGSHGQTILHAPNGKFPHTLQLGVPEFMAAQLGVPVVSDFRAKDIALGGQGAPLIPFFDEYIFGKGTPKILLNLGGIANLSLIGKNIKTIGFDAGPANSLIDLGAKLLFQQPFDKNGAHAAKGTPDKKRATKLLLQPFFKQKPPKSLDKNEFGRAYLTRYFGPISAARADDILASVTYFTAAAVANQITRFIPRRYQQELIISGGGCYNKTLLKFLRELLPHVKITTTAEYGIDPQAKEAAAFALFAWLTLHRKINHCARATGAKRASILGKITL